MPAATADSTTTPRTPLGRRRAGASIALVAALAACGCESPSLLVVQVRTDFRPSVDFESVLTTASQDGVSVTRSYEVSPGDDFLSAAARVSEIELRRGVVELEVQLLDRDSRTVARRRAVVQLGQVTSATLVVSSACVDIDCGPMACLAGECVDPTCTEENPEACGEGCRSDTECTDREVDCLIGRCLGGACLTPPSDAACPDGRSCHPDGRCRPTTPPTPSWVSPSLTNPSAIDLDGDRMSVGQSGEAMAAGRVAVLERDPTGWFEVASLDGSAPDERRCRTVGLDGDSIVTGSPDRGDLWLYTRQPDGSWIEELALDLDPRFGGTVAISGVRAVSSRTQARTPGTSNDGGFLQFFSRAAGAWASDGMPTGPASIQTDSRLGWALAMEDDRLVATAPRHDVVEGVAYVYEHDGSAWVEVASMRAPPEEREYNDAMGTSVALAGDRAFFGSVPYMAFTDLDRSEEPGSVFVFERDASTGEWTFRTRIVPSDGGPGDGFGRAIAAVGDLLYVSATDHGPRGTVYLFERAADGAWVELAQLVPPPDLTPAPTQFGRQLAAPDGAVAIGSTGPLMVFDVDLAR